MWIKLLIIFTVYMNAPLSYGVDSIIHPKFKEVLDSKELNFPKDHGSHPEFKTEWWYFTGHLQNNFAKKFGLELTFFRVGVNTQNSMRSKWAVQSIYLAHFAITDDENDSFNHAEKISRDNFSKAGSSLSTLDVWIDDWSAKLKDNTILLSANSEDISISLNLTPFKNVVLQGRDGFSQKGPKIGQASYYSSFTNLKGSGTIRIKNTIHQISKAKVWMDHEVTSSDIAYGIEGWDWFAIQLDDDSELMIYQLRDKQNNPTKYSSGTIIYPDGQTKRLNNSDFKITPHSTWKSKTTNINYPHEWTIIVPKDEIELVIVPTVKNQEMTTSKSTRNSYWEGRSTVTGRVKGKEKTGNAYVELVGYEEKNISGQ